MSVTRQESANRYQQIVSELYAGGVISLFTVLACLSYGPLIFHGELSGCVSQGIGVGLISAVVTGGIISLRSSYAGTIAIPQDRTAPILGLMAAQIASQLPEVSSIETKCITILLTIGLTSVLAGIILYLLGGYRLGNLVRFIPYPVIGGFLAGSGWLLVRGGAQVMTGMPFSFANLDHLLEGPSLTKLILGAGLGTAMFLAARKLRRPLIVPGMLVGAILIFYALMGASGHSIAQARAGGWLVELPPGADFLPQLWNVQLLAAVEWTSLIGVVGIAGTVLLTAIISILLNSSGLELVVGQEIDFNKELEVAGSANFVAGLGGGMLGFQSLSLSRLAYELGARTRLTGLVAVTICAAVFLIGPSPLSYLPNLVLGGLLFYLGLGFLVEWVVDSRSKLPLADYAVVLLILAVVGSAGYMQGVAVGILAAVFLFIHNYSRVGIITHALTGAERQSNVDRPLMHQRILLELGAQTYVLKLQGFLFFGTATGLLNDIRNRLQDITLAPLRFVVLDFRRVSGLDSSATVSLLKAQRLAEQSGFYLVLTSLPDHVHSQLKKAGFQSERDGSCKLFRDLDHGIEWCEERTLTPDLAGQIEAPASLVAQLEQIWPNPGSVQKLMPYLERQTLDRGAYLIRQGDNSNCLYFVESGELTAQLEINDGTTHRLRRQGAGTVLGELGLFLGVPRTASVVAEMFSVVYRLSADSLRRLKAEDPHLAADFHEFLVRYLAERVVNCNRAIRAMSE